MLTEQDIAFPGPATATGGFHPGLRTLAAALLGALRRHRMRAVLRDLAEREDYLLADIGITREWLERTMAGPAALRSGARLSVERLRQE